MGAGLNPTPSAIPSPPQLDYDLETEEAERTRLAPLWAAVAAPADRYSTAKIMERLFRVFGAAGR